ncbi:vWA domain-containing protein [Guggenheimella bovis]
MTELVFILDRSGSMRGLELDTIGGFNSMLHKQRQEPDEALISTVLFDHESVVIHDRVPLKEVSDLTEKEYFVRSSTALLDAVGSAIHHISNVHKYARKEDVPEKTLFIITTDGMENSSHVYTYKSVQKMIKEKREKKGWEFLFLGANIDAPEEAEKMGIEPDMAVTYHSDKEGTALNYEVLSDAIMYARCCDAPLTKDWKKVIDEDFQKRGGKNKKK